MAKGSVNLKRSDQHYVSGAGERIEVGAGPAVVFSYHDPGQAQAFDLLHQLIGSEGAVWGSPDSCERVDLR